MARIMLLAALVVACIAVGSAYAEEGPTVTIHGIVKDAAGRPVEGATLRLARTEWNPANIERWFVGGPRHSGKDGRFEFTVPPHGAYAIVAERGGAVGMAPTRYVPRDCDVEIVLAEPRRISGRVVDEAGEPVAGATVAPFRSNQNLLLGSDLFFSVLTDAAGGFTAVLPRQRTAAPDAFSVDDSPSQDDHLVVHAAGYAPLIAAAPEHVDDLTLVVKRGAGVTGRVLAVPNHEGVADVPVVCVPDAGFGRIVTVTDESGRFEFSSLLEGYSNLRVAGTAWVLAGHEPQLDINASSPIEDVRVFVRRTGMVEGRVYDQATNLPLAGVAILLANRQSEVTGPDGRYHVEGIAPGAHTFSFLLPDGFPLIRSKDRPRVDVISGATRRADIAIPMGTPIVGRVVDNRGAPVEGASVYAEDDEGPSCRTVSASDGTFTLYGFEPGMEVRCRTVADGYLEAQGLKMLPETESSELTVVLRIAGAVRGRVLSASGTPMPGAAVHIRDPMHDSHAVSDAEGRFDLLSVKPGMCTIQGSIWVFSENDMHYSSADAEVEVMAGETATVEIVLPPVEQNEISGWVRDQAGRPLPGVYVGPTAQTFFGSPPFPTSVTDSEGHFTVRYFGPGPCRPIAHVGGLKGGQPIIPAADGKIILEVPRGFVFKGRVVSAATGEPVPEFTVSLRRGTEATGWRNSQQHYDPEGNFQISSPWAGEYTLTARTPEGAEGVAVVAAADGQDPEAVVLRVR